MRGITRLVGAVVLLMLLAPLTAASARAISGPSDWFGCKTVPAAESPTDGFAGWILPAPAQAPTSVDPTSGASLLQNYGVSGMSWVTFDDDCDFGTGGVMNAPDRVTDGIASAVFMPATAIAAGTVAAGNAFGNPDWLDFLNPAIASVASSLSRAFTQPLMPIFVLIAGLTGLALVMRGALSRVIQIGAFTLLGLAVVGLTVGYPVRAATVVDDAVSSLVLQGQQTVVKGQGASPTAADREQPGAAMIGELYKGLIWDTWLRGQLGSEDSAVGRKYGYALYESRNLTYTERATASADPSGAGRKIFEAKAKRFKEVADQIKAEDPSAYANLTAGNFGQRFALAAGGSAVALVAFSIPFFSFLLLLLCFLYWRFTIMLGPILGAVIVMMHGVARSIARKLAAVVLNTIIFGLGAAVFIAVAGFITASALAFGWQIFGLTVLTVVGWLVLHPIRALTRFAEFNAPGYDGVPGGGLVRKAGGAAVHYAATRRGVSDAENDTENSEPADGSRSDDGPGTHQWAPTGPGPTPGPLTPDSATAEQPPASTPPAPPLSSTPLIEVSQPRAADRVGAMALSTSEAPPHRRIAELDQELAQLSGIQPREQAPRGLEPARAVHTYIGESSGGIYDAETKTVITTSGGLVPRNGHS